MFSSAALHRRFCFGGEQNKSGGDAPHSKSFLANPAAHCKPAVEGLATRGLGFIRSEEEVPMMRNLAPLLFLAFLTALAGGCSSHTGQGDTPKSERTIGLSVLTLANPFFKEIADSMSAEAGKHGYAVRAVSGDNDPAKQRNQVKDFIVQKVSAIVLTPCDSRAVGPVIKEANAAGIPVFTADIACLDPNAKVVSHVATDNYGGGREAAKAMIEALGGKGKIAILDYPEVESVIQRTKGFEDELAAFKSKLEIVTRLPGGGDREKSYKATQDILQAHRDLAGIFAINDPSALGAVSALEKAGKLGQIKVIGFDGQPDGKRAIKAGHIYADPIQFPDQIGQKTVTTIVDYFAGEDVPPQVLIPTKLYRRADALKDPALP
jgi:ribose transport system substrate-binding protein